MDLARRQSTNIKEGFRIIRKFYTDYTLVCDGEEFPVHRVVLHIHSNVFAAAFADSWKQDRVLKMHETEPDVVKAMLDWFYETDYNVPENASKLVFHLKVHKLADYYAAGVLVDACRRQFGIECDGDKWTVRDLTEAVRYLDDKQGMDGHDVLKTKLLATIKDNLPRLLGSEEFRDLLSEFKELNVELLTLMTAPVEQGTTPVILTQTPRARGPFPAPLPQGAPRGRGSGALQRGGRGHGGGGG